MPVMTRPPKAEKIAKKLLKINVGEKSVISHKETSASPQLNPSIGIGNVSQTYS